MATYTLEPEHFHKLIEFCISKIKQIECQFKSSQVYLLLNVCQSIVFEQINSTNGIYPLFIGTIWLHWGHLCIKLSDVQSKVARQLCWWYPFHFISFQLFSKRHITMIDSVSNEKRSALDNRMHLQWIFIEFEMKCMSYAIVQCTSSHKSSWPLIK